MNANTKVVPKEIGNEAAAQAKETATQATQVAKAVIAEAQAPAGITRANMMDAAQTEAHFRGLTAQEVEVKDFNEMDYIMDSSVVAKPLIMPEVLKMRGRDPHYAYRWVNWKSAGGSWFKTQLAMGFVPCDEKDIVQHNGQIIDGRITVGDLMLCKIDRDKLGAALKKNFETANRMQNKIHAVAKNEGMAEIQAPPEAVAKNVQFFQPGAQFDEKLGRFIDEDTAKANLRP
jgi:hypothetical protein